MPNIGRGFPEDWRHSNIQLLRDLFTTLRYMAGYTVLVYNHCQGTAMQSTGALTDQRNSIQHRLLSLPPHPYEQCSEGICRLYESTRLTAEVYSLLCVYPYPRGHAPFGELASLLRKELSGLDLGNVSYEESKLLLWILVMGAIVTVGALERLWFISTLRHVSGRLELESWQEMKSILTTFLWLDMTNDIDGSDVWDEVSPSRYKHGGSVGTGSPCSPYPSLGLSLNMTIRTRSTSAADFEEKPTPDRPFSRPS
jgi:hypothetical protein